MKNLFLLFCFYSFAGFLLEILYARLTHQTKRDRKCFLFLPLCPVYGIGVLVLLSLPPSVLQRPLLLFFIGGLTATAIEYAVSLFYEVSTGVRFWDYTDKIGNVHGRICPLYSLFWGGLAVGCIRILHPMVSPLLSAVPDRLVWILFPLLAADGLITLWLLHHAGSTDILKWYPTATGR